VNSFVIASIVTHRFVLQFGGNMGKLFKEHNRRERIDSRILLLS